MKVERKLSFAEFGGDDIYSILSIFTILLWIMFCSFVNTKVQEVKA